MISSKTGDRFPIEEIHEAMHNEFIEGKDFEAFEQAQISLEEAFQYQKAQIDLEEPDLIRFLKLRAMLNFYMNPQNPENEIPNKYAKHWNDAVIKSIKAEIKEKYPQWKTWNPKQCKL